tara:strand:+ start:2516 stop:3340 length:825 start_codon:yes stop_codon:yes gene_type:complete
MTQDNTQTRFSLHDIQARKKSETPLVCLTSYTTPMTKILDRHCDILLVGDSLGMVVYGMDNTLGVTLDMMINHGKAVMRASKQAFVVVDMPYSTYENDPDQAYETAKRIIDETGCHAVKLEGGTHIAAIIAHLVQNDIPVMAHIGLKPQSVVKEGGYKIKGKTNQEVSDLLDDAKAVEKAGAFAVVIEGTIEKVSQEITTAIDIPTIGIGASVTCDGQILVIDDMLGMFTDHTAKFVKQYANLADDIDKAAAQYADDVKKRLFPAQEHVYKGKP